MNLCTYQNKKQIEGNRNKSMKTLKLFFIVLVLIATKVNSQNKNQSVHNASTKWFTDARFGMFIHWDISSIAGTEISWSRKGTKPLDITGDPAGYVEDPVYDILYKKFNPIKFNATQLVNLAKKAGMKYIVFTAKHHDGFAMWDTKLTDYSIMQSPYKKDIVKQLADACHKAGMKLGIYYSQRDWHHPEYGIGDNKAYIKYMNGQLKELLTNYGKIDMLWWDSYGTGDLEKFWQIGNTYNLVKKLQPGIIMNNRLAVLAEYNKQPKAYLGDWDTPEQVIGKFQNTRPWESCMTLAIGAWGYQPNARLLNYTECIKMLVSCATGDGNLLLNVGPDATGTVVTEQANRLGKIGDWLKKYGASIYATKGGPYKNGAWGGATFKGNRIYIHVSKWDGNTLKLPNLKAKILKCSNFTNPLNKPKLVQDGENLTITMLAAQQDPVDTIIVLELATSASQELINGEPIAVL